jgi:hypothetical protein
VLTLGFLNFGRATHVGRRFIYLEEGAEFAYGADDPVFAERLELLHTFKGSDCVQWYPVVVVGRMETPHEPGGSSEERWRQGEYIVLVERQIRVREVELDCGISQIVPHGEVNEGDKPCFTALAVFASSDSSMTASSETEGTISCGRASSTVVAILFYFFEIEVSGECYVIHVIPSGDKARGFQWLSCDWAFGRMDPELSEVDYRNVGLYKSRSEPFLLPSPSTTTSSTLKHIAAVVYHP